MCSADNCRRSLLEYLHTCCTLSFTPPCCFETVDVQYNFWWLCTHQLVVTANIFVVPGSTCSLSVIVPVATACSGDDVCPLCVAASTTARVCVCQAYKVQRRCSTWNLLTMVLGPVAWRHVLVVQNCQLQEFARFRSPVTGH